MRVREPRAARIRATPASRFRTLEVSFLDAWAQGRIHHVNRTAVEHSGRSGWTELIDTPLSAQGPGEPWATLAELVATLRALAKVRLWAGAT